MKKDPVCGMSLEPAKAESKRDFDGQTYYFCCSDCRHKFDANPSQFSE